MARRIRVSGFDPDKITESEKLADVLDLIEQQDSEHVYILATYTAMLEMREILANRHYVNGEMK
jgi:UDP-N-acetylmuramoyl-L-alanyl-D-glutamate--2,6-diaminopimelate ligase